jgi:hypothetical protein
MACAVLQYYTSEQLQSKSNQPKGTNR